MSTPVSATIALVIGYGMPGRASTEALRASGFRVRVVEANPQTVARCGRGQVEMVCGDGSNPKTLQDASIESAEVVVVAVPDDQSALRITQLVRELNPSARLMVRCHYLSTGLEARRRGADEVVVAEQVMASEMGRRIVATYRPGPVQAATGAIR